MNSDRTPGLGNKIKQCRLGHFDHFVACRAITLHVYWYLDRGATLIRGAILLHRLIWSC
jgi:hypothetical protein